MFLLQIGGVNQNAMKGMLTSCDPFFAENELELIAKVEAQAKEIAALKGMNFN